MIATLTTDFGNRDGFVGVMKGIILGMAPQAVLVDVSHEIAPADIRSAAWVINNSCAYFPKDTIHLVIVDPGVGSGRRAIAIRTAEHTFIGPDNGVLCDVVSHAGANDCFWLNKTEFWRTRVSNTFHGRDVFAPVLGHLLAGKTLEEMGEQIPYESLVRLSEFPLNVTGPEARGAVVYVDRFGNLITNLPGNLLETAKSVQVNAARVAVGKTYSSVSKGNAAAIVGSHGFIEIGVNQGRAAEVFSAFVGSAVVVKLK